MRISKGRVGRGISNGKSARKALEIKEKLNFLLGNLSTVSEIFRKFNSQIREDRFDVGLIFMSKNLKTI